MEILFEPQNHLAQSYFKVQKHIEDILKNYKDHTFQNDIVNVPWPVKPTQPHTYLYKPTQGIFYCIGRLPNQN